jgi:hypothetical protein
MTEPERARAIDILERMTKKERVGVIDTIYIYIWFFAVTEYGEALKLTMYMMGVWALLISLLSYLHMLGWGSLIVSGVVAFCFGTLFTGLFGAVIAVLIMIVTSMVVALYYAIHWVGFV